MRPRAICGTRKTSQIKLNAPVKPRETAPRPGHPPAATSASTSASTATTAPSTLADPRGWPPMQPPPPAARGHSFGLGLGHARALPALPPPPATAATAHNPLKRRQLLPPDAPGGFRPASYPSHPLASASHPHTSAGYPHVSAGYPHASAGHPHTSAGYPSHPHAAGALPGVSALLQPAHRKRSLSGGSAAPVVAPRPRVASPPPDWEPASPRSVYLNLVDRSAMTPRGHPLAGHGHPHGLSPYASTPASARLVNQHPVYGQPPASAASPQSDASAGAVHDKPSRYLREMDRRVILARIDRGEKQSALAKEFRVSRAAICNLYKHRDEVLSRKDGNPLAKHPKKPRPKGSAASKKLKPSTSTAAAAPAVHQLRTRAAALLLTTLRKKHADARTVRRSAARLVRLVLEEALALVPMKAVDIELGSGDRADGVTLEHPPCALAVVPAADAAHPMLDVFADMEPEQPAGRVLAANPKCPRLEGKNLPPTLEFHNVFLLELTADDADRAIAAVRLALERGAVESMISIVTLAIAREVVDELRVVFPAVRVVAAQIVEETDGSDGVDADAFRARLAIVDE